MARRNSDLKKARLMSDTCDRDSAKNENVARVGEFGISRRQRHPGSANPELNESRRTPDSGCSSLCVRSLNTIGLKQLP